jgi:hypothetical protein
MRSSQGVTYPDFFIVGAPKCGTTALFTYLQKHPQVFMCGIKEPQFLAADILGDARQVRNWKDYLACFSEAEPSAKVGEGSVAYLGSPRRPRPSGSSIPTPRSSSCFAIPWT